MSERRLRSIPPITALSRRRLEKRGFRFQSIQEEPDKRNEFDGGRYLYQKPAPKVQREPLLHENGEIKVKFEVNDLNGNLVLITEQIAGINLTHTPFIRCLGNFGPDSIVFYTPAKYGKLNVNLFLGTYGDIFGVQVTPPKGKTPIFQDEQFLQELGKVYNPLSMTVKETNGIIIVTYNPL